MRRIVLLAAVVLTVAGCRSSARNQELAASVDAARAACNAQPYTTAVDRARCMNEAEAPLRGAVIPPDLFDVRTTNRLMLAEKVDRKELTQAEADARFAGLNSQLVGTQQSRNNAAAVAAAARSANDPVSCTKIGNTTTCY